MPAHSHSEHASGPWLTGVVGWPIAHSLSPLIHRHWAEAAGVDVYYAPIGVQPGYEAFAGAMAAARTLGYRGLNVTLPHKENALQFAEREGQASEAALAAGAANMITFTESGVVAGNSDISGFASALADIDALRTGAAVVLGAGGAARAVALALKAAGWRDILLINRTLERARDAAAALGARVARWEAREDALAEADIVVNATSLGMTGGSALVLDLSSLRVSAVVCDVVYAPLETPLLADARARGFATLDGLSMLMHQASRAFEHWTGAPAPVTPALREKLLDHLRARGRL